VLDRPADVAAQPVLDSALDDQRRDDDQAPVAKRENVVAPCSADRDDRFVGEAIPEPLCERGRNLVGLDAELRREGVEAALVAVGIRADGTSLSRRLHRPAPGRFGPR
jgi:hypothetical protein